MSPELLLGLTHAPIFPHAPPQGPTRPLPAGTVRYRGHVPSLILRRPARALAALLTATTLTLAGCATDEVDTSVEAPVGLAVDAARVTLQSAGEAPGRVLTFTDAAEDPDAAEQTVTVEVSEVFDQSLLRADAVDVQAPAGGDVTTLTLPLSGRTTTAPDPEPDSEIEREATREVDLRTGEPSSSDLSLLEDLRSTEGFRVGWRAGDSGRPSTVNLAAPVDATDEGRAMTEQAVMKILSLPTIFPEEPVGVGAVWSVDSRVTGEATLLQTTTFTLTGLDGDLVELDVNVQQRPALGALSLEGQPGAEEMAGETLNVLNSNTTSEGSLTVDLNSPLPVAGQVAYTTRVIYGGQDADVRVVQDSTTAVAYR